jgi:RNA polymerase sigma-70 factor (ECF subfamily)
MAFALEYVQHTDESLLGLIARHDADALAALYDRHAQTVYNMIARIVHEPATADEVLQDTFWQVWQKASEFHGGGAAAAWLYRIARNKSLDQLRRQKARPQPLTTDESGEQSVWATLAAVGAEVERITEHAWRRQHVREALTSLPADQRLCLELAYFEGMSQRQIAEYTATPVGTVKTRVRMGLEKLERILRAAGYQPEDIER